jgi:hypothetical protein
MLCHGENQKAFGFARSQSGRLIFLKVVFHNPPHVYDMLRHGENQKAFGFARSQSGGNFQNKIFENYF